MTLTYRQRDVSIEIDGVPAGTRRLFTAMIGNTENGGGGMKLLPGASFDDGVLDLIEMGGVSRLGVLLGIMPKLYSGAHVHHPKVRTARGTSSASTRRRDPGRPRRRDGGPPAAGGHRPATGLPGRDGLEEPPDERRVQKGAGEAFFMRRALVLATSALL